MSISSKEVERLGYSIQELAIGVGCSERHVKNQIAKGKIPCVKIGVRTIIPAWWVKSQFGAAQLTNEDDIEAVA